MSLEELILGGETERLAFQEEPPSKSRAFAGTASALANGVGGTLLIGVSPDGRVVGIPEDEISSERAAAEADLSNICRPPIPSDVTFTTVCGKTVIVLDIEKGRRPPYLVLTDGGEAAFARTGSATRIADPRLLYDRSSGSGFDRQFCDAPPGVPVNELIGLGSGAGIPSHHSFPSELGLIEETGTGYRVSNAFALLTSNPFPHFFIRCFSYGGTKRVSYKGSEEFKGGIGEQIAGAERYAEAVLERSASAARPDIAAAFREAIANAVQHRDYTVEEPITAEFFSDRIEVSSPGIARCRIDTLTKGRSDPRNALLSAAMRKLGLSSPAGTGMPRITACCPGARAEEGGGRFVLTLPFGIAEPKDVPHLSRNEMRIVSELAADEHLTAKGLSEKADIPLGTVRRLMNQLSRRGVIVRRGSRKSGVWIVSR